MLTADYSESSESESDWSGTSCSSCDSDALARREALLRFDDQAHTAKAFLARRVANTVDAVRVQAQALSTRLVSFVMVSLDPPFAFATLLGGEMDLPNDPGVMYDLVRVCVRRRRVCAHLLISPISSSSSATGYHSIARHESNYV